MLVATAGALPPGSVTSLVEHLVRFGGTVSVMTSIGVPRSFLEELATEEWRPFAEEIRPPETEAAVAKYVEERGRRLVEPLVGALEAAGIAAQPMFIEDDDPARAIVETAAQIEADLIVMGATRPIFDADAWASVSVKVMQQSTTPLLLVPGAARNAEKDESVPPLV